MCESDKAKTITADIQVRIGADGVWLGFFAEDGRSAVVSLDKLSAGLPEGSVSRAALAAWAADRVKQATASPA